MRLLLPILMVIAGPGCWRATDSDADHSESGTGNDHSTDTTHSSSFVGDSDVMGVCDGIIQFGDANLEAEVRRQAGLSDQDLYLEDVQDITFLRVEFSLLSDLTGIQCLSGLTVLHINNNSIRDISALSSLSKLTSLWLGDNEISNITPLAGLTNLTVLYLSENNLTDITALSRLTHLSDLALPSNFIRDITAVSGLTNLTRLTLQTNSVRDIEAVSGLVNLAVLGLDANSVSDLTPLLDNEGIGAGDMITIRQNALDCEAPEIQEQLTILSERGAGIFHDCE